MNIKKVFTGILILFVILRVSAQAPAGYYNNAEGKSTQTLKSALFGIINNHTALSYQELWNAFRKTDVRSDGKVWGMYTNCNFTFGSDQCGNYKNICDCYNREHSFPKSWFDDKAPMYTDLFHIYPTDGKVNGMRSNYPFGETSSGTNWGICKLGKSSYPGYSGTVFEPADEYKGDFARTYFYMLTCYMNVCKSWSSPMLNNGEFTGWATSMLLKWNDEDPVSKKEIDRNNVIYKSYQHNRNPFIDYPELAAKIFGDDKTPFSTKPNGVENAVSEINNIYAFGHTVRIDIKQSTPLSILVYDISGKVVKSINETIDSVYDFEIDSDNGIYIIQVITPTQSYSKKIILN